MRWFGALIGAPFAVCAVGGVTPSYAGNKMELPDPEPAPTSVITERGESPTYWRLPDNSIAGWSRVNLGASSRLSVRGEEAQTTFALSVLGGAELGTGRTSPVSFVTELGYSYVYESQHWFVFGLGPGLRRLAGSSDDADADLRPMGQLGLTMIPHGIVGTYDGETAYGVRTSLVARYLTLGLEVAHQYARVPAQQRNVHEILFGISMVYAQGDFL